ncbi:MAG: hypothetical protein KDA24_25840 [Deltaproteobacteria bacterium]|nr:hypothetical protein [Deltaproteobacteria bacterium]
MILVTGTMRSGTSMWMQILIAAGLPHLGEAFPAEWGTALKPANPRGFFESQLVAGVYYATNPQPETGVYLFPQQTREHAVKVFVPGLVRTDSAFLDRVVATVREWREFASSLDRMASLAEVDREAMLFAEARLDAPLRWWVENFALVRDIATRRYPAHVTTYGRLVSNPAQEVAAVIKWIGRGNARAAADAVEPALQSVRDGPTPSSVSPAHAQVFDDLYAHIHEGRDLSPSFIELLNQTDHELRPRISAAHDRQRAAVAQRITHAQASPA